MVTIGNFNAMMESFLDELSQTFPEHTEICVFHTMFDDVIKTNVRAALKIFMKATQPYSQMIMEKNSDLFSQKLDIGGDWT